MANINHLMAGLYIHIPFCKSRCIYCGFYSTTLSPLQDRYVDALCKEMEYAKLKKQYSEPKTESLKLKTVYLGGGTPSQLSAENLRRLFIYINKVYDVNKNAEITMECNPDDVTEQYVAVMKDCGINRVSMGVQTFSDKRLKYIRRRHNAEQADHAVNLLRNAGIDNISIDLIFGFPEETLDDWRDDIRHALSLNIEHISAYSLMFEKGTPLYAMLEDGKVKETDEETSLAMYNELIEKLTAAGYEHYEISNFARRGRRSRHNSSYWHGVPYIGIGAAAHSYDIASRRWNVDDIHEYMHSIEHGVIPAEREVIDKSTRYNDMVMTALRTCEGIDLKQCRQDFGDEYTDYLTNGAKEYISRGLLAISDGRIHLTRKGIFVSDSIMSDLMMV